MLNQRGQKARVGVAQGKNDISALVAGVTMADKARDNVTAKLASSWNNPDAKKIRELTVLDRKNKTNTAQEYMQGLIDTETADIQKKAQAAADLLGGAKPKPKPDAPKTTLNPKLPPTRTIAGKTYKLQEDGTYKLQE